ncbi:endonuclease/exonuclease/phosphatase family protein [Streptomyces smaragdinus]|uniref:endonuclease/exonuclease/phosphatase family protein n=1 Tax=Streptomyces smaragdinus TaxID=2585196 RepID=UPI0012978D69|nr:endonuclease/exonuclease/phosphatase family protein [Streptomyces smaragdinus]
MTVRLLTFNVLFKGDVRPRLRALSRLLGRYDVVCLQELMLRRNVPLVTGAFAHGGCHGRPLVRGGLVVLSRWPVGPLAFHRFPYVRPARTEWLMRKGAQTAVVHTPDGELTVVNTHLSANRDDDWSDGNRWTGVQRAELDRLTGIITATAGPLAVVGDLNLPPDSALFRGFLAASGLTDTRAGESGPTYRPTPSWPAPPALDHVLTRGLTARTRLVFQDDVRLADGRPAFLSDHYGIAADLTTPGTSW